MPCRVGLIITTISYLILDIVIKSIGANKECYHIHHDYSQKEDADKPGHIVYFS